jgi:hypothetical protein
MIVTTSVSDVPVTVPAGTIDEFIWIEAISTGGSTFDAAWSCTAAPSSRGWVKSSTCGGPVGDV